MYGHFWNPQVLSFHLRNSGFHVWIRLNYSISGPLEIMASLKGGRGIRNQCHFFNSRFEKKLNALMMTKEASESLYCQEPGNFCCHDGHCIDSERVCDSIPDCQDGQTMEMSGSKKEKGKPGFTN